MLQLKLEKVAAVLSAAAVAGLLGLSAFAGSDDSVTCEATQVERNADLSAVLAAQKNPIILEKTLNNYEGASENGIQFAATEIKSMGYLLRIFSRSKPGMGADAGAQPIAKGSPAVLHLSADGFEYTLKCSVK